MKKNVIVVCSLICFALLSACASKPFTKTENSVQIKVDSLNVALYIISPEIIRVTATPIGIVLPDTSLMVVKQKVYTNWNVVLEG